MLRHQLGTNISEGSSQTGGSTQKYSFSSIMTTSGQMPQHRADF
jgi:hypothetical protein